MQAQVLPERLLDFAWIPSLEGRLQALASQAEPEDWRPQNASNSYPHPILRNYIMRTYTRLAEEQKIVFSVNQDRACFNTGLVTPNQEPLFAVFGPNPNRDQGYPPWMFLGWYRRGQRELNEFQALPDLAHYFDDSSVLVLDTGKELRVNIEHIIEQTPRERFPREYRSQENFALINMLDGAISAAKDRVRRNYKVAIPQYYRGQVQLLLPLCLSDPRKADLALVLEIHQGYYRASTCLTLDMAYNNARQLVRPDRDWLQP